MQSECGFTERHKVVVHDAGLINLKQLRSISHSTIQQSNVVRIRLHCTCINNEVSPSMILKMEINTVLLTP